MQYTAMFVSKQLAVPVVMTEGSQEEDGELGRTSSANSVMEGVSIEVESEISLLAALSFAPVLTLPLLFCPEKLANGNVFADSDDYGDLDDLQVEDLFKGKNRIPVFDLFINNSVMSF